MISVTFIETFTACNPPFLDTNPSNPRKPNTRSAIQTNTLAEESTLELDTIDDSPFNNARFWSRHVLRITF